MQNDPKDQDVSSDVADDEVSTGEESSFDAEAVETVVMSETDFTDNVGDVSVEINVEELVAKVESEQDDDAARKKAVRQRLEDLAENRNLEDTYAVEFDKD